MLNDGARTTLLKWMKQVGRATQKRERGEGSLPPDWHEEQSGVLIYVYVRRMVMFAGLLPAHHHELQSERGVSHLPLIFFFVGVH